MEFLTLFYNFIIKFFDWWYMVQPWEQALHIRAGKKVKLKEKGIYLKVPFIDTIFVQTTRMKIIDVPAQTVSTPDGKAITVISTIQYSISDMEKLYNTMSHPEMTLSSMVMREIADFTFKTKEAEKVNAKNCQKYINRIIDAEQFGLKEVKINITTWANVPTYRLIMDGSAVTEGLDMTSIEGTGVD